MLPLKKDRLIGVYSSLLKDLKKTRKGLKANNVEEYNKQIISNLTTLFAEAILLLSSSTFIILLSPYKDNFIKTWMSRNVRFLSFGLFSHW